MIYVTHDIDWLNPWHPFAIAKTFTHGNKWLRLGQLKNQALFLNGIETLLKFNQSKAINAIWLIGATNEFPFKNKGLRYTFSCQATKKALAMLMENNAEIGLHSVSTEPIIEQCNRLNETIKKETNYHRSHYLNYSPQTLYPQLKQAKISIDFSLGTAREVSLPKLDTFNEDGLRLIPTILFDNIFFFQKPEVVFEKFKSVLREVKSTQSDVAILFHPENFLINPALWEYYQECIRLINQH